MLKLGRLPTSPHRRAANWMVRPELAQLPSAPAAWDLSGGPSNWPMYGNDRYGDCTCAAIGHMEEIWTDQVDGAPLTLQDSDILALYNLVNGGVDQGANMLDVLNVLRTSGLAGHTIKAFAEVSPSDHSLVGAACWLYSGLYIGAALPLTAQDQQTWAYVNAAGNQPGSWGGHAVNVVAFSRHGVEIVTWGELKFVTWGFWDHYVDEVYAILPADYDRLTRPLPNGQSELQLTQYLPSI